jgi:ParB family transcriptional regulator, chromosome partitioning protein
MFLAPLLLLGFSLGVVRDLRGALLGMVHRAGWLCACLAQLAFARQHGIKRTKDSDSMMKLFAAYLHRIEEGALGGLLVGITILLAATRQNTAQVLRDAATAYKLDIDAITLKVKQEFAAKENGSTDKKDAAKAPTKAVKKAKAA